MVVAMNPLTISHTKEGCQEVPFGTSTPRSPSMRVSQEFDVVRSETKTLSSLRQDEDGCCVAHIVWDDGTRTSNVSTVATQ